MGFVDDKPFFVSVQNLTVNQSNIMILVAVDDFTLAEVLIQNAGFFEKQGEGFD